MPHPLSKAEGRTFNGPRLRGVRQVAGIRMIDLSRAMKCSYGHLRMAEKGERRVSVEFVYSAARQLTALAGREVSIDEFTDPEPGRSAA